MAAAASAAEEFASAAADATAAVETLHAALDSLPDTKHISVVVDTVGGTGDVGLGGMAGQAAAAAAATDILSEALARESALAGVAADINDGLARTYITEAASAQFLRDINAGLASMWVDQAAAADASIAALGRTSDAQTGMAAATVAAAAATDRQRSALWGTVPAAGAFVTGLQVAHLLVGAFGANVIADAVGITAFGIAATHAIGPVVTSLDTLTTSYGQLDNFQKAAALSLQSFLNSLGGSEAGIFTVFNQGLSLIESHMSGAGGVTHQATVAFMDFAAMLKQQFSSPAWAQLFSRGAQSIRTDLDALFGLLSNVAGLIPGLFHDFNGLGLGIIGFASGVLHATAAVANFDPTLTKWAAGIGLAATAWHILGNRISWIPTMGAVLANVGNDFRNVYAGARIAGLGIGESTIAALGAVPAFTLAAGAGIAFVAAANAMPDPVARIVSSLAQQNQAVGDNVVGYQRLSAALGQYLTGARQLPNDVSRRALQGIAQAQYQASQTAKTLGDNFGYLSQKYGLNRQQAFQLAQVTGISLKSALTGTSASAVQARDKIAAYEQTVKAASSVESQFSYDMSQANNTALTMTARLQGLSTAFSVLSGPTLQAMSASAQFKQSLAGLHQAARAAGDVVGTNTQKQAALTQALAVSTSAAMADSTAILNQTHSASAAQGPLIAMRDMILQLGLRGQAAAALVAQLNQEINALHSKTVTVTANGMNSAIGQAQILAWWLGKLQSKTITITTVYQSVGVAGVGGHTGQGPMGHASGTTSAPAGLAVVGERGPELMAFAGGERVWSAQQTRQLLTPVAHPEYSTGLGGGAPVQLHSTIQVHLDGKQIFETVKTETLQYGARNGNPGSGRLAPARR